MGFKSYWGVRREGVTMAWGSKDSFPNEEERKNLRAGGHKIYLEGKLFREGKT